ncbi:hypothetical protein [Paenibacillus thermotolerans]|uniref:hypothetical protein n=1 Tax=Paenibacillus thermotolerans TaxID=3027807 RepID=UPI0023686B9B|nr:MULTISPECIES: hypothetical protein [unclassified Paenibacillus]
MKRYFFYMVIVNMLVNIITFVPSILTAHRFGGSVMSFLFAVPIGTVMIYMLLWALSRFPGRGMPEMLDEAGLPKWISVPINLYYALLWFAAGGISILVAAEISVKYISPETPFISGIFLFLVTACAISRLSSEKLLYFLEIIVIIVLPLIVFVIFKSYTTRNLNFDAIMVLGTHIYELPTWRVLAGSTFVFSGFTHMVIFNRVFHRPVTRKWIWLLPIMGLFVMITALVVPVGMQGADGVADYSFPWITTADSMQIELGFIERVLYVIFLLYSGAACASFIMYVHVAMELIKSVFPSLQKKKKLAFWSEWGILALFAGMTISVSLNFTESLLFDISFHWIDIRFGSEIALVAIAAFAAFRRRLRS